MGRFDDILALGPVRFYVSPEEHFDGGLALLGNENGESAEKVVSTSPTFEAIPNCKPGIWTSRSRKVPSDNEGDADTECIVYWVADGTIDLAQSVEDWKKYEEETRDKDGAVKLSQIVPKGTKWRKAGSYYDDGGICNIISTVYLTEDAGKKVMFGTEEEEHELNYGYYVESLTLGYQDNESLIANGRNEMCTLGGMSFGQDCVGGPPNIALAEDENGKVIALRMYQSEIPEGEDDVPEEGPEDGFTSADDEEAYMDS
ncbi:hypothetical protein B7463_g6922, partial [Scytalidium lignicola]